MTTLEQLERRIGSIEDRNSRVTTDKAWETSLARRLTITALTYAAVNVYLHLIANPNPWTNAVVPAVGYFLSTLVLAEFRSMWVRSRKSK